MRKILFILQWVVLAFFLAVCLFLCSGCKPLESLASDVGGWDLSSCVSDIGTCWELYFDNRDNFASGFTSAMNVLDTE